MTDSQTVLVARLIDQEYDRLDDRVDYLLNLKDVALQVLEGDDQADSLRKIDDELSVIYGNQKDLRVLTDELFPTVFDLEEVA
jgi:hypothetical protein